MNPRMSQDSYSNFYNAEYRHLYHGNENYVEQVFSNEYDRGILIYEYIRQNSITERIGKNPFVVEMGCGSGGILKAFEDRGFSVAGFDLNEKCIEYGKNEHNLDLRIGTLRDICFHRPPDLIICSHVVEHFVHPVRELLGLRSLLSNTGFMYIEVPGIKYLRRGKYDFLDTLQNAHIFYFTLTTLRNFLGTNGFAFTCGSEYIRSIFSKGSEEHTRSGIENDYYKTRKFLLSIEKERLLFPIPPFRLLRRIKLIFDYFRGSQRIPSLPA
jgi:2-polyprenyl-3-methyl-5-hydroxy-6-metoxy-1,4-benzoquinol methylase